HKQARQLLSTQPTWSAIALFAPDGRQLANTGRPIGDALPSTGDRESFDRTVATRQPVIGNLRVGAIIQQQGFPVRVPVIRDGRVVYVISAFITSASFGSLIQRQDSVSDEWVRGVVDASGILVARSRDADRFVGQRGTPAFLERQRSGEGVYRDVALDGTEV